jgi:hypothetical protein
MTDGRISGNSVGTPISDHWFSDHMSVVDDSDSGSHRPFFQEPTSGQSLLR